MDHRDRADVVEVRAGDLRVVPLPRAPGHDPYHSLPAHRLVHGGDQRRIVEGQRDDCEGIEDGVLHRQERERVRDRRQVDHRWSFGAGLHRFGRRGVGRLERPFRDRNPRIDLLGGHGLLV